MSQTLVMGGPDAKKLSIYTNYQLSINKNFFFLVSFRPQKIQGPLFAVKIMSQPHGKACKCNFYWKICGNFFQVPPYKVQKF